MTYKDKASYDSTPPCISVHWNVYRLSPSRRLVTRSLVTVTRPTISFHQKPYYSFSQLTKTELLATNTTHNYTTLPSPVVILRCACKGSYLLHSVLQSAPHRVNSLALSPHYNTHCNTLQHEQTFDSLALSPHEFVTWVQEKIPSGIFPRSILTSFKHLDTRDAPFAVKLCIWLR